MPITAAERIVASILHPIVPTLGDRNRFTAHRTLLQPRP
jgi:hypothetical protein